MNSTHSRRVRRLRSTLLWVLASAGTLGWTSLALALPPEIKLSKPAQLEIVRNGQPAGKLSLAAGTTLAMTAIDGEFVLVRYRGVNGRVLATATDLAARMSAEESGEAAEPAKAAAPPPKASETPKVSTPAPVVPAPAKQTVRPSTGPQQTSGVKPVDSPHATTEEAMSKSERMWLIGAWAAFLVIVAAQWRLFTKARKPGWASLVPIYNMIVWQQISGKPLWWIVLYFIPVVNLVVAVLTIFGIANNFGKGMGFGFGLLLAPFFFLPVLAFGDAVYVGR